MLHHHFIERAGILVLKPEGPISAQDTQAVRAVAESYLAGHKHIHGLLIDAQHFSGYEDIAGFIGHVRLVAEIHERVEKVALVTDTKIPPVAEFMATHFVNQNIRHFPYAERDAALVWLGENTTSAL